MRPAFPSYVASSSSRWRRACAMTRNSWGRKIDTKNWHQNQLCLLSPSSPNVWITGGTWICWLCWLNLEELNFYISSSSPRRYASLSFNRVGHWNPPNAFSLWSEETPIGSVKWRKLQNAWKAEFFCFCQHCRPDFFHVLWANQFCPESCSQSGSDPRVLSDTSGKCSKMLKAHLPKEDLPAKGLFWNRFSSPTTQDLLPPEPRGIWLCLARLFMASNETSENANQALTGLGLLPTLQNDYWEPRGKDSMPTAAVVLEVVTDVEWCVG